MYMGRNQGVITAGGDVSMRMIHNVGNNNWCRCIVWKKMVRGLKYDSWKREYTNIRRRVLG